MIPTCRFPVFTSCSFAAFFTYTLQWVKCKESFPRLCVFTSSLQGLIFNILTKSLRIVFPHKLLTKIKYYSITILQALRPSLHTFSPDGLILQLNSQSQCHHSLPLKITSYYGYSSNYEYIRPFHTALTHPKLILCDKQQPPIILTHNITTPTITPGPSLLSYLSMNVRQSFLKFIYN